MRFAWVFGRIFTLLFFLICSASAEIKIKVVDPQDAAVAGAQVQLLEAGKSAPAALQNTSGEGVVTFREKPSSSYRVVVLAPGFAEETRDLSPKDDAVTVKLRLATAAETVVVTFPL